MTFGRHLYREHAIEPHERMVAAHTAAFHARALGARMRLAAGTPRLAEAEPVLLGALSHSDPRAAFEAAVGLAPTSARTLVALGDWYQMRGDRDLAASAYRLAVEGAPANAAGAAASAKLFLLSGCIVSSLYVGALRPTTCTSTCRS